MAAEESEGLLSAQQQIDHFLCQALRGEPEPWDALDSVVGSEQVLSRCRQQGVASLVHHIVKDHPVGQSWPQDFRKSLEVISKAQVAQEMLRGHSLCKLLRRFAELDVRCLVIKGEALAQTLYPVPGTRTRGDSDLFIDMADIDKVSQAIDDCGFVMGYPLYKSHQFTVRGKGPDAGSFEFDVHWRILNAPRFSRKITFDEAFDHSVELTGMEPARTLNAVDTLLLMCMHRSGSEWHDVNRLIWIYDLHQLVNGMARGELLEFARKAVGLDVQSVCREGLLKAQSLFTTVVPADVLVVLDTPERQPGFARRLKDSNLGLLMDDWRHLPNGRARMALIGELFFPPASVLDSRYGKSPGPGRLWRYSRHIVRGLAARLTLR